MLRLEKAVTGKDKTYFGIGSWIAKMSPKSATTLALTIYAFIMAGCDSPYDRCESIPKVYDYPPLDVFTIPENTGLVIDDRTMEAIRFCYQQYPYSDFQGNLTLESARSEGNGHYLVFEVDGVSDLRIIYELNEQLNILAAYHDSL